jgi:hypothetical protein
MTCTGFYGGVSGGPWIENYDRATGTGKVIGNTGGYNGGGNDANDDWVTYAPIYGKEAQSLFNDAAAHRTVGARPPYQPSTGSPVLPGSAGTWQHARLLASGDIRHSGHFDPTRLLASNSAWAHAQTITAGDYYIGNGATDDLVIRRSDDETTMYTATGATRPGNEHTLVAASP